MVDKGCIKSFDWESRAQELGYAGSKEMLEDLLINKMMSYKQASKAIGLYCYYHAKRLGIHTGRPRGGANRCESILEDLCEDNPTNVELIRSMTTKAASLHFGVSYETIRQFKVRKGWIVISKRPRYLKESKIISQAPIEQISMKPVKSLSSSSSRKKDSASPKAT